jgi:hypothetical protein
LQSSLSRSKRQKNTRIQQFRGGNDSEENYFAGAGEEKGEGKTNLDKQLPVELSLFLLSHSGISSPDIS